MLEKPLGSLPGVGPVREKALARLGLVTIEDLLYHYPRGYQDFTRVWDPGEAADGQTALFAGHPALVKERRLSNNRRHITAVLEGERGVLMLSWFLTMRGRGSTFLHRRLTKEEELWVFGHVVRGPQGLAVTGGDWFVQRPPVIFRPLYARTQGITNDQLVRWTGLALQHAEELDEVIPEPYRPNSWTKPRALRAMHFPRSGEEQDKARSFLVFEEFFLFQLGLLFGQERFKSAPSQRDGSLVQDFLASHPFALTVGQKQAVRQIGKAMESTRAMRCLLQGDVGSGKTVVAEYAVVKAVESGGQAAFMVPTEVLAHQMTKRLQESLKPLGIRAARLTGGISGRERQGILKALSEGCIDVAVGTHALLNRHVEFSNLTLAVIDEQHRFGVNQRTILRDKGAADLLVMSATPIPRSLALCLYSDLDAIVIPDLPQNRLPVDTRLIHPSHRNRVYAFVVKRVLAGEQAFVVFPLVEESDTLGLRAAVKEMEELSRGWLKSVRVGLVHGQLGSEKEDVLNRFTAGNLDVLVSTTVIEVGMDMPRATVMVIEEAQRFGLAQLHQLRGRVGRSSRQSYCFLLAGDPSESGWNRLQVIRETTDGLRIAEEDLRQRGPGDFLGTRQSGEPLFRLADISADRECLEEAAQAVRKLLADDPRLETHRELSRVVRRTSFAGK